MRSDDLLEIYTNREFAKVYAALDRVHELLEPMFAAVPAAFTGPRGKSNMKRGTIARIRRLAEDGVRVAEIARLVRVSRQTVHRWLPSGEAEETPGT